MKLRSLALLASLAVASFTPAPAHAEDPQRAMPVPGEPPASSAAAPPASSLGKLPALVTGGLAVVTLGTGAVFGVLAWQDHEDFQLHPSADTANRGESRGLTADMCFGAAATLGVAAAVMYLTHEDPTESKHASRVVVAPFVAAGGGGAGAIVRF